MMSMVGKRAFVQTAELLLGAFLVLCPTIMAAQHHGGHGGAGGVAGANNRPTGVDEKDPLRDFHRAMAVEATSQQAGEFQALVKETDTAKSSLQTFVENRQKPGAAPETVIPVTEIDQLLGRLRADSQKFVEGFSAVQKSGLKENLKKLAKADSDLQASQQRLDASSGAGSSGTEFAARGETVITSLGEFSDQQLALGSEMGIVLAQGSDLTFTLPEVRSLVTLGNQTAEVPVSGELSQIAAQGAQRTFRLRMVVDLSELEERTTEIFRAQLDAARSCGERLAVREATMTSATPAALVALQLHYERWSCLGLAGQTGSQELAEQEGAVEVKLTPLVGKGNTLKLAAEFSKIVAGGAMGESLHSGDLGEELRDRLTRSILSALPLGENFPKYLPPAAREFAILQEAKFQDTGVGKLSVILDGQLDLSDQQVNLMASQLNEAKFARGTAPPQGPAALNSTPNR
jgi:hypothetical protein